MEPIKKVPLVHQVEEQLKKLIDEENYQAGDKLPTELELCQALGVSRGTVREAFRYLQAKGVVELRVGKGAFVAEKRDDENNEAISWLVENEKDLQNLIEIRAAIEPLAAKLSAKKYDPELIYKLKKIQSGFIDNADVSNYELLAKLDEEFHHTIAAHCGNTMLTDIIAKLEEGVRPFRINTFKVNQNIQDTIIPHEKIVKAIASGNPDKAEREMKKHIDRIVENLTLNVSASENK